MCAFLTKGAASCHRIGSQSIEHSKSSWGVVLFWVDSGSFCTAVVSRRRSIDVVIFSAFGGVQIL